MSCGFIRYQRPLHGVMSGTRIRQKFAKKRSLPGVNEHFSRIFNAIIVPRSNRAKVSINKTILLISLAKHKEALVANWLES
ncbi:hypothetical protein SAMN06296273_2177 [Nitrosomonas ureae]|uniref:Uncharacterized protein n=1 Tax=Nitrosomonas ureae TaxID=44577 RepID=A0A285C0N3_9PROT|nr:hypothetical protein SAMN06296273_2177 [Nitrosomonas ureae]